MNPESTLENGALQKGGKNVKHKFAKTKRKGSGLARAALVAVAILAVGAALYAYRSFSNQPVSIAELARTTHFHGIAVDPHDSSRLYLATHHGFFIVSPDGMATRLSGVMDMMGFTPNPAQPDILYASGHPSGGGNLGFMTSEDDGKTWRQLSKGLGGPVDFHQMDVSKADARVIYGAYGGIQVSRDGGISWLPVGPAPTRLIALAASARDVNVVYAATERGLLISRDGGKSWRPAYPPGRPASTVFTTPNGDVYAFVLDTGLIHATEPGLQWQVLGSGFGNAYLLHLAVDPTNKERLYAVTSQGTVLASRDGGRTWAVFGAS